jgi:hypothetical protein
LTGPLSACIENRFREPLSPFTETAHTGQVPDDDDRPRDASSAADSGGTDAAHAAASWSDAVAPDDISDLAADIAAYRRERRAAHRRELIRSLLARRGAGAVSLFVAALVAVAAVAAISVLTSGRSQPAARPLAKTTVTAGQQGSLLRNVALTDLRGRTIQAQSLRPALVAVIPLRCNCQPLLTSWADKAASAHVQMVVVAPTVQDPEATALGGQLENGTVYYDRTGQLARDFHVTKPTGVLVNRDASVYRVLSGAAPDANVPLVSLLQQMLQRTSG